MHLVGQGAQNDWVSTVIKFLYDPVQLDPSHHPSVQINCEYVFTV
jgi:hypothetical protein